MCRFENCAVWQRVVCQPACFRSILLATRSGGRVTLSPSGAARETIDYRPVTPMLDSSASTASGPHHEVRVFSPASAAGAAGQQADLIARLAQAVPQPEERMSQTTVSRCRSLLAPQQRIQGARWTTVGDGPADLARKTVAVALARRDASAAPRGRRRVGAHRPGLAILAALARRTGGDGAARPRRAFHAGRI